MPLIGLRRHCSPSTISRARRHLHGRWVRQWPRRRSMECLDRQHGEPERSLGLLARFLWPGSCSGATDCYDNDYQGV
jgi:hypothetical protein